MWKKSFEKKAGCSNCFEINFLHSFQSKYVLLIFNSICSWTNSLLLKYIRFQQWSPITWIHYADFILKISSNPHSSTNAIIVIRAQQTRNRWVWYFYQISPKWYAWNSIAIAHLPANPIKIYVTLYRRNELAWHTEVPQYRKHKAPARKPNTR